MTQGIMVVNLDKGGIKNRSVDDGGAQESARKHNNQMRMGVGVDDNDAQMLLSWMMGKRTVDSGSADHGNTGKHTVNSGG